MKTCPFCAEEIQDAAVVCKHCGRKLESTDNQPKGTGGRSAAIAGGGCLLVLLLMAGLVWLGQCADARERAREASEAAERRAREAREAPERRKREVEANYTIGKEELAAGNNAAAFQALSRVRDLDPDYKDVEELLSRPEMVAEREAMRVSRKPKLYVLKDGNVRSGPGFHFGVADTVKKGDTLHRESLDGSWFRIARPEGGEQWVHESLVRTEEEQRQIDSASLRLIDWRWTREHGWATAEGRVQNVTGASLENVEAVVQWTTSSGEFITANDCLIDYNPLLAGQTSPFKCMARANPAMAKAGVEFKKLMGGRLAHYSD